MSNDQIILFYKITINFHNFNVYLNKVKLKNLLAILARNSKKNKEIYSYKIGKFFLNKVIPNGEMTVFLYKI